MPIFERLEWGRFDVWAIVSMYGVVVVDERHADSCRAWLARHDYRLDEVDCSKGLAHLVVLALWRPDIPWREDARWMHGLFAIAREHCHAQLAIGQRFFCVLFLPEESPLIGQRYEGLGSVPSVYRTRPNETDPFDR